MDKENLAIELSELFAKAGKETEISVENLRSVKDAEFLQQETFAIRNEFPDLKEEASSLLKQISETVDELLQSPFREGTNAEKFEIALSRAFYDNENAYHACGPYSVEAENRISDDGTPLKHFEVYDNDVPVAHFTAEQGKDSVFVFIENPIDNDIYQTANILDALLEKFHTEAVLEYPEYLDVEEVMFDRAEKSGKSYVVNMEDEDMEILAERIGYVDAEDMEFCSEGGKLYAIHPNAEEKQEVPLFPDEKKALHKIIERTEKRMNQENIKE